MGAHVHTLTNISRPHYSLYWQSALAVMERHQTQASTHTYTHTYQVLGLSSWSAQFPHGFNAARHITTAAFYFFCPVISQATPHRLDHSDFISAFVHILRSKDSVTVNLPSFLSEKREQEVAATDFKRNDSGQQQQQKGHWCAPYLFSSLTEGFQARQEKDWTPITKQLLFHVPQNETSLSGKNISSTLLLGILRVKMRDKYFSALLL